MTSNWGFGLLKSMTDPELKIFEDSKTVIIKDMYPKSTYHFLVLCKEEIASIKNLNRQHLPLLELMEHNAKTYVNKAFPSVEFRLGYHANPSMNRLHLHVISIDMISDCLKTKKHWNSFVTEFFIPSSVVLDQLRNTGKIKLPTLSRCEELLKKDLMCHRCSTKFSNMPKLKEHLYSHN